MSVVGVSGAAQRQLLSCVGSDLESRQASEEKHQQWALFIFLKVGRIGIGTRESDPGCERPTFEIEQNVAGFASDSRKLVTSRNS